MHIREATLDDVPGIARVHVDTWRTPTPASCRPSIWPGCPMNAAKPAGASTVQGR